MVTKVSRGKTHKNTAFRSQFLAVPRHPGTGQSETTARQDSLRLSISTSYQNQENYQFAL
jgi:hypothetical protein